MNLKLHQKKEWQMQTPYHSFRINLEISKRYFLVSNWHNSWIFIIVIWLDAWILHFWNYFFHWFFFGTWSNMVDYECGLCYQNLDNAKILWFHFLLQGNASKLPKGSSNRISSSLKLQYLKNGLLFVTRPVIPSNKKFWLCKNLILVQFNYS